GAVRTSRPRAGGLRLSPRAPQQHKFGLFEIGPEHQFHLLTCRLRMGLRAATQAAIDHPPDTPCDSDFVAVLRQPHEGFELLTYAGPAFARLRRALGLPEELYQAALSSRYFQFVSNSKSKARFFLTQDKRFFLKTQTKQEMRLLLANLPRYLRHLEAFPHSLLVRLLGEGALPCPQRYFTVTLSVFFPDEGILERYDIKGCSVDRWAEPASAVVLKDLNFEGKSLVLGKAWGARGGDTAFPHSLLVRLLGEGGRGGIGGSWGGFGGAHGLTLSQNLPRGSNPLHCIDGPQRRYSVGLVDLFTSYTFRRRLEHLWKRIRYRDGSFSTVPPAAYARRLCQWVEAHSE
uniref:Phosphatidylinositol-4-phosphate 5-kinase like 1 n=1 Tax=Anas zonorhyncha TaxID=75864 RepID=A0A8B9VWD0_9AVES